MNKGEGVGGRAFPIPMAAGSPESSLLRKDRRIFKPPSQEACSIKQDANAVFSQTNLLAVGQGPATRACFLKQPNGNFLIKQNLKKKKPHHGTVKGRFPGSNKKHHTYRPLWKHGKMKQRRVGSFGVHPWHQSTYVLPWAPRHPPA